MSSTPSAQHLFALEQALALYDAYQEKALACDARIEAALKQLSFRRSREVNPLPSPRRGLRRQPNGPGFDVRAALFALLGKDLTQINGLGPYLALKLIAECGDDLSAWPSAKHFTSWLCLAPSNKIALVAHAPLGEPSRRAPEALLHGDDGTNRHRPGCLLPTVFGAHRQG